MYIPSAGPARGFPKPVQKCARRPGPNAEEATREADFKASFVIQKKIDVIFAEIYRIIKDFVL